MNNLKVSIVLPCYNGAYFLAQSIESCIAQTFTDWELIIVDDCSTDDSLNIALQYAEQDSRIRVYHNEVNKKLPASLNIGFSYARGEYLTWTSHDNKMGQTMLEEFVEYLDVHQDVGMVTANYAAFDQSGKILYEVSHPDPMLYLSMYNAVCYAFMYRREVMEKIGGYAEDLFLIEDYEYWVRIWKNFKIGKIYKVLYYTGVSDKTLTASRKQEIAQKLLEVRLMYFKDFDFFLKDYPMHRRDYYISILDVLSLGQRLRYQLKFSCRMPLKFGMYYCLWYAPKRFFKKFSFYKSVRNLLKHA